MKGDGVVVDVLVSPFDVHPGVAIVFAAHEVVVGLIQHAKAMRVGPQFLIVVRPGSAGNEIIGLRPTGAVIFTSPEIRLCVREVRSLRKRTLLFCGET